MEELRRQHVIGGELLLCAILELVIVRIGYRIDRGKSAPYLSAAAWAIVLGVSRAKDAGLDPQIIFFGLLPPIILEAGFSVKHRAFFANFWDNFLLGIVGTLFSTAGIALGLYWLGRSPLMVTGLSPAEALQYGTLISAIDPVASQLVLRKSHVPGLLPELVFGERSLNNAITVAIFNLCQERVQSGDTRVSFSNGMVLLAELVGVGGGSLVLAGVVGFSSAYLLRNADDALKQHPVYEISILLLFAYASYLAGEFFHLSGHLAVFFSGAFIRHYHMHNISHASATTFKHLLRTMAFLAENFIFIYLGLSFYMVVLWLSGLRGAIAFGLSLNVHTLESDPTHAAIIRSSTIFTVLCSTIVSTFMMGPLVRCLGLAHTCETHAHMRPHNPEQAPLLSSTSEEEAAWIRDAWTEFDERNLQPYFGHGRCRNDSNEPEGNNEPS